MTKHDQLLLLTEVIDLMWNHALTDKELLSILLICRQALLRKADEKHKDDSPEKEAING